MTVSHKRRIFVHDLACEAKIGIYPHEKTRASIVHIDLDAFMEDTPHNDHIEKTVCYDQLADIALKIAGARRVNLAETLAEQIADACLAETNISRIRVRVRKQHTRKDAGNVGVEITRDQKG